MPDTPGAPVKAAINRSPLPNHLNPLFRAVGPQSRASTGLLAAATDDVFSFGVFESGVFDGFISSGGVTNSFRFEISSSGTLTGIEYNSGGSIAFAKDTSTSLNVYIESGELKVQNLLVADATVVLSRIAVLSV